MKKQINGKFSEVINLIKKKPYIVWYCQDIDNLSVEAVIENVLNWGILRILRK